MNHLEDNMNSITELRINVLTLELLLWLIELIKTCFGLTTFCQCFECCQRGFPRLKVIRAVEKETIYGLNVASTNANGIYCVVKTIFKLTFIEMAETKTQ